MESHLYVSLFHSSKRPRKLLGKGFMPQGCVSHWNKALEDILSLGWNSAQAVPASSLSQDATFPALPSYWEKWAVQVFLELCPALSIVNRLYQAHQTQKHFVFDTFQW